MLEQAVSKPWGASGQDQALEVLASYDELDHLLHDLCSQQRSMVIGSRTSGMFSNAALLWTVTSLVFPFPKKTDTEYSFLIIHQEQQAAQAGTL